VEAWLRRWSGARTFEKFWKPLLRAKLGENYQYASASFIWATIRRLFAARRAGLEERFGYVPGGYDRILKRFEEVLRAEGVELRFNAQLTGVKAAEAGVDVTFADGTGARYERVVMTLPGPVAAKSCADFSPAERTSLLGIRYQGIVCPSLLLSRPLGPYYVTNIADASIPFTGVIEMSTLVSPSEFGGSSLVYLPKYVDPADPLFERSDDEIQDQFLAALAKMYPDFQRQTVRAFQVSRARHVFAIPTLNYSSSIPPVKTSVPGVYVLNSSHIVNGTLNVNETVQLVETHLPLLLS
jgi:protoporphyrinogen oxidase